MFITAKITLFKAAGASRIDEDGYSVKNLHGQSISNIPCNFYKNSSFVDNEDPKFRYSAKAIISAKDWLATGERLQSSSNLYVRGTVIAVSEWPLTFKPIVRVKYSSITGQIVIYFK